MISTEHWWGVYLRTIKARPGRANMLFYLKNFSVPPIHLAIKYIMFMCGKYLFTARKNSLKSFCSECDFIIGISNMFSSQTRNTRSYSWLFLLMWNSVESKDSSRRKKEFLRFFFRFCYYPLSLSTLKTRLNQYIVYQGSAKAGLSQPAFYSCSRWSDDS